MRRFTKRATEPAVVGGLSGAMLFMAAFSSESFSMANRRWEIFLAALAVLGAVELPMFVLFVLP